MLVGVLAAVTGWTGLASGELVYGPSAQSDFESYRGTLGDTFVDFESVANGPLTTLPGLTFRTTIQRWPRPPVAVDYPVAVLPWDFVNGSDNNRLMAVRTPAPSAIPDGRSVFQIEFDEAQRRAGVVRIWANTYPLTRFYSASGLIAEHQKTTIDPEFVGYLCESDDPAAWITRIEMDGLQYPGTDAEQVGEADDLYYGSNPIPEPSTLALMCMAAIAMVWRWRRRH
jgi:hypothetical protein